MRRNTKTADRSRLFSRRLYDTYLFVACDLEMGTPLGEKMDEYKLNKLPKCAEIRKQPTAADCSLGDYMKKKVVRYF